MSPRRIRNGRPALVGRPGGCRPTAGRLPAFCRSPVAARLKPMPMAGSLRAERRARRGERFTALMAAIVPRLPFGLARIVAPNILWVAVISAVSFTLDLSLLIARHGGVGRPRPGGARLAHTPGARR